MKIRGTSIRRLLTEQLESKRLLSADGLASCDREMAEHASGEREHASEHEFEMEHESEREHAQDQDHDEEHEGPEDGEGSQLELHARLAGDTAARGEAEYESEAEHGRTEQKFKVTVEQAAPETAYSVAVDGIVVGELTTDAQGRGRFGLSSDPGSDEADLPADFPAISPQSVVTVGSLLTGSFDGTSGSTTDDGTSSESDDHGDDDLDHGSDDNLDDSSGDDDLHGESSQELEAYLRSDGTAQGKAEFEAESEHGGQQQEFSVRISNADPATSYDVVVNGVTVGQITTDDLGRGFLKLQSGDDHGTPLPADFPTIEVGSTIQVGELLSGTFQADDGHSGDLNDDQVLNQDDIDMLHAAIAANARDARYDVDGSQQVDAQDASFLIEVVMDSVVGDANLDGIFDSHDLIEVLQAGQFEDGVRGNSTWKTGDWNGDGEFDTSDLVFALQKGAYRS